ncbi:Asp-tRNA(Asn)/Glu-tRNA(Gln) amidotransferase subunit GatA [Aerococcaceae bacterium DSM 111020]|nr:Asp-tRNA(Asn)/Glu-tRNA(Gln) amidotransferase subunit GatA [Aerococcaceae bacterium DSM 111020]
MTQFPRTITEIQAGLREGKFTAVELIEDVLSGIETTDEQLNAFITLNKEEALEQAKQADDRGYGDDSPALNGVPIAVKDNILTRGLTTTAASKMLAEFVPTYDATVVKKLKEAGAVIVGKTNLDEFAMGGGNETSYFGKVHNPWDLERVPGGSSGGSAAAVASGQVPAALGTDTGGSIRQPSAFNNLVGLKPTYGAVSRLGAIAFGSSLDQIGPMTKTVLDNAKLMAVISGHDEWDSTSLPNLDRDYTAKIGQSLEGLKIGFPKEYQSDTVDEDIRQQMQQAAKYFESQGAIVEEVSLPHSKYGINVYYIVASAEAASNLQRFDGIRYGYRAEDAKSLEEIYVKSRSQGFGEEVKRRIILGTYSLGSGQYDLFYKKAAQIRTLIKQDFEKVFESYDLIMGPTTTSTAFKIGEREDDVVKSYMSDLLTVPYNLAGIPVMSIPAGFDRNHLPIGLQLAAKPMDEATLYQVAHAFEQDHDYVNQTPSN